MSSELILTTKLHFILRNESLRLGFLLSQGGEFAFVLLSLANTLRVLPEDLNQVRFRGEMLTIQVLLVT